MDADAFGDGDRSDKFALGVIERVENGVARPITDRARLILGLPGYTGDVDGDGMDDPLFDQQARIIRIEIHLVQREENGRFLRTTVRGGVHLRNIQK